MFTLLAPGDYIGSTCSGNSIIQFVDNVTCADLPDQPFGMTITTVPVPVPTTTTLMAPVTVPSTTTQPTVTSDQTIAILPSVTSNQAIPSVTRVLWNTYPVHCLLHEIM